MADDDSKPARVRPRVPADRKQHLPEQQILHGLPASLRAELEALKSTIITTTGDASPVDEASAEGDTKTLRIGHEVVRVPFARDSPGLPNGIMRAALFPVLPADGVRPFLKKMPIFSVSGLSVSFTGQRFDQSDLDVLLGIFEIGRYEEMGHKFTFAAHALLKLLGKTAGGSDHEWLHSVLTRLTGGIVEIRHNKRRFFGALLLGGKLEEGNGQYTIAINAELAVMFGFGMWSYVDREQRGALGRNQTAKVFHLYYSSHAAPGKHSYETVP